MLTWNALHHPVGAKVFVTHDSTPVGVGVVGEDHRFTIEIADDLRGELELNMDRLGAATAFIEATGDDLDAVMLYNPINNSYA